MRRTQAADVLRGMPLFRDIDENQLRVVALTSEVLSFRDGERIIEQDDEADSAFIVLEGRASVVLRTASGEERPVALLGPGELIGEIAALTDRPRTASVDAEGDTVVMRLPRETLIGLLRQFPDFALRLIRVLAERLMATTARTR